jgi:hypothetical protein
LKTAVLTGASRTSSSPAVEAGVVGAATVVAVVGDFAIEAA